ncbi:hypothetical protein FB451DRAFT_1187622 [Mycena latifolia]|nr:hypothetical protein FB451DRAFT_1187622 [Mycena latifolia]
MWPKTAEIRVYIWETQVKSGRKQVLYIKDSKRSFGVKVVTQRFANCAAAAPDAILELKRYLKIPLVPARVESRIGGTGLTSRILARASVGIYQYKDPAETPATCTSPVGNNRYPVLEDAADASRSILKTSACKYLQTEAQTEESSQITIACGRNNTVRLVMGAGREYPQDTQKKNSKGARRHAEHPGYLRDSLGIFTWQFQPVGSGKAQMVEGRIARVGIVDDSQNDPNPILETDFIWREGVLNGSIGRPGWGILKRKTGRFEVKLALDP